MAVSNTNHGGVKINTLTVAEPTNAPWHGIYFKDNEVKRVVATRADAKVYYVSLVNGKIVEKLMEPERIA